MQFSQDFKSAFNDYRDFLTKGYPQKSILKLVGDRYKLSGDERVMLYRGVDANDVSVARRKKLISLNNIADGPLCIDGLNQLLTIASYMNGSSVFISTDGFLRDASEIHSKAFRVKLLDKAYLILFSCLQELGSIRLVFYFDRQVDQSKSIAHKARIISEKENVPTEINITNNVDQEIINVSDGFIATSDSQIIEKSNVFVFDMARHCLEKEFNPYFFDLNSIQS